MAWIKSHQELRDHPKTRRMAHMLRISRPQAIGHLQCLWWWCLDYADDGDLSKFDPLDIALGADWEGDENNFVDVLVNVGFLDVNADGSGLSVHDWSDYAGALVRRRVANTERMQKARAQHVRNMCTTDSEHVQVPEKTREEKKREETTTDVVVGGANAPHKPNRAAQVPKDFAVTDAHEAWGAAQSPPFSRAELEAEAPQFVDFWTAKGEPRKDWDASFRTWMRNSRKFANSRAPARAAPGGKPTGLSKLLSEIAEDDDRERARDQENPGDSVSALATRVATGRNRPDDRPRLRDGVPRTGPPDATASRW